jgi:cytoskeletal protein CcmA (bactofilin family)
MWRKEDGNPQASPEFSPQSFVAADPVKAGSSSLSSTPTPAHRAPACVSQGIKIKGDVTGTEDLFIDGHVDGKITLTNSCLTVGPNGIVKAEIAARELVLRGIAEGKFTAVERIQIWHTARVQGELKSERISIEDGAELRGKVEAGKAASKVVAPNEPIGRTKKVDQTKTTDAAATDANVTPDAATAGAD